MKPISDVVEWPKIAVFDIEAQSWVNVRCLCHVDEWGTRKQFYTVQEYVLWCFSPEFKGSHIWAHWGGKYDNRFVLFEAWLRKHSFDVVLSGNLMVVLTVTHTETGRIIRFCESARLMPDSVEEIGKSIDPGDGSLLKLDADVTDVDKIPWDDLVTYCYRDCDIIVQALMRMRTKLTAKGCDFAFTLASIASRFIRRSGVIDCWKFYEKDPERTGRIRPIPHIFDVDKIVDDAYHGGRTEVFRIGYFGIDAQEESRRGTFRLYDITSSYPSAMRYELPSYFIGTMPPLRSMLKSLERCGISEAIVKIPAGAMKYPLLPARIEGKMMFPTGLLKKDLVTGVGGHWTNIELLEVYKLLEGTPGFEMKLKVQYVYEPRAFLKPFVELFWGERLKAILKKDEFEKYAWKILLNAAYGKLGENDTKEKVVHGAAVFEAKRKYGRNKIKPSAVNGIYFVEHKQLGAFRHAAAAAYVTARGRIQLWQAFMEAERQGAHVLYADTDSVFVDKPIFGSVEKEKVLGEWHLESNVTRMHIFAAKVYMYETDKGELVYKAKGMPVKRREHKWRPDETRKLFLQYTRRFQENNYQIPDEDPSKEGIRGLLTDLKDVHQKDEYGVELRPIDRTPAPRAFSLKRGLRNLDTKRQHAGGFSEPHHYEDGYERTAKSGGVSKKREVGTKIKYRKIG